MLTPLTYSILSCVRTRMNRVSLKWHLVEGPVTCDFTLHLRVCDHTTWVWKCVGTPFGRFPLGSHNFTISWLVCEVALSIMDNPQRTSHDTCAQCVFLTKFLRSFWHLTPKNLHTIKLHVNWHTWFKFGHVEWLVKKKYITPIDTLKTEMTRTTRLVT